MCIRDSFTSAPANMSNDEAHTPGFWLGNVALPRVAQWRDCLLYTSDAADERSSVDLGGRRIIKKKKSVAE